MSIRLHCSELTYFQSVLAGLYGHNMVDIEPVLRSLYVLITDLFQWGHTVTFNNIQYWFTPIDQPHIWLKICRPKIWCKFSFALIQNLTRTTRMPTFWGYPPPPHDYPYHWVILDPKSKEDKVKFTNLRNSPKFQIFEFWNRHYTRHTCWSCLIRCANMKWIQWVLLNLQSGHDSVHWRTDGRTDKVIRVYPTFNFVEAGGILIGLLQNFAHDMTAVLSRHVQKILCIWWPKIELRQISIFHGVWTLITLDIQVLHLSINTASVVKQSILPLLSKQCPLDVNGLVQGCSISSVNALEIPHPCTRPSTSSLSSKHLGTYRVNLN